MSATQIDSQAEDAAAGHPGDRVYFNMLALLAALTIIEVIVFYVTESVVLRAAILVVLLLIKFVAQVGWFTHLRYDDRRLSLVFGGCLLIAFSVVVATILMMAADGMFIGHNYG